MVRSLFLFLLTFLIFQIQGFSQRKIEFGMDLLPLYKYKSNGLEYDFFFKSFLENGDLRIKLGHRKQPIHERELINIVHVSDKCVDKVSFINYHQPSSHFFLNFGYSKRENIKSVYFLYGLDFGLGFYKGSTITYRAFCLSENNGAHGISLFRYSSDSNYSSIGIIPHIAIKVPFFEHKVFLTLETGLRANLIFGERSYVDFWGGNSLLRFSRVNLDWGNITSDIAISFAF